MPSSESGTCDLCKTTVQLTKDGTNYPIGVRIKAKGEAEPEAAEVHVEGKTFAACEFNENMIREIN